jgi:hypothetical protein
MQSIQCSRIACPGVSRFPATSAALSLKFIISRSACFFGTQGSFPSKGAIDLFRRRTGLEAFGPSYSVPCYAEVSEMFPVAVDQFHFFKSIRI